MKKMIESQSGLTIWGVIFVVAFIASVTLFTLRAYPLFYERLQVAKAMESVSKQENITKLREDEIRNAFIKALQITNVSRFSRDTIKEYLNVEKERGGPSMLVLKYDATSPLFSDLMLMMRIEESVPLTGPSTGDK